MSIVLIVLQGLFEVRMRAFSNRIRLPNRKTKEETHERLGAGEGLFWSDFE